MLAGEGGTGCGCGGGGVGRGRGRPLGREKAEGRGYLPITFLKRGPDSSGCTLPHSSPIPEAGPHPPELEGLSEDKSWLEGLALQSTVVRWAEGLDIKGQFSSLRREVHSQCS